MHVLLQRRRLVADTHTLKSREGGGHPEQLTVLHVVNFAVFWDSVPDLSVLWENVGVFWVLGFFSPLNLVAIVTLVKFLMESVAMQSE